MKRNNLLRFVIVLVVLAWSLYEIYPPKDREIIEYFNEHAVARDANFNSIVEKARSLRTETPERGFANLKDAIGTNDLVRYFPQFDAKNESNPNNYILNKLQRGAAGRIKLGLDLKGGTSFLVQMDTNQLATVESTTNNLGQISYKTNYAEVQGALDHAVEVLRKRVDRFGVAEPVIQPAGANQILIQLPGLSDAVREEAKTNIQKAAFLEFKLVHDESQARLAAGEIPPGYSVMTKVRTLDDGTKQAEKYVVKNKPELTGSVQSAGITRDEYGRPRIVFRLNDAGAAAFAKITTANEGRLLAIILDGELQTAPVLREPILTGSGEISGDYTEREAFSLATVLENPLRAPLSIIEERSVNASLGVDAIKSGVTASLIAAVGTFLFMLVFYFASGLIANLALAFNILILMGAMCALGSTLTMPGIAGIALTIGMAVDANVLIYERMREEMATGKSIRGVIAAGYNKAFGTIFDSHVTTVIAAIILMKFGTGPVQGFGVTLTIGIAASLFTALVVTRLVYDFLLERGWLNNIRMLPMIKLPQFKFMNWGKLTCGFSVAVIIIGLGYGIMQGEKVLGVDFRGGDALTLTYKQRVGEDQLRRVLDDAKFSDTTPGYERNLATGLQTLQMVVPIGEGDRAANVLTNAFPQAGFEVEGKDMVGATVGKHIQETAIIAAIIAMFAILVYVAFRYEFSFAIASVIALLHDVLVTLAIYFLSGRQLTAPMVAAVLTIIGYSINDKIVIMDRIREDLKIGVRGTFRELIDVALNQTLSRTIITGGAVILATLALFIFGGGVINDFAFFFLVGIISGTYSSLFIAAPIVLWWHKGKRPNIGGGAITVPTAGAETPATAKP